MVENLLCRNRGPKFLHCKPLVIKQPPIHKLEGTSSFSNSNHRISHSVSVLFSAGYMVSKDQSPENPRSGDGKSRARRGCQGLEFLK